MCKLFFYKLIIFKINLLINFLFRDMCKKINEDALAIKILIANGGIKYAEIARLLKISRQKVYYWARNDFKISQKVRKKFSKFYFDKIIKLARNKSTSSMSCSKG